MEKMLCPIGNSLGIIIDRPILELLKITPDTILDVRTDGRKLVIEPVQQPSAKRVKEAAQKVLKKHDRVFKKLAK